MFVYYIPGSVWSVLPARMNEWPQKWTLSTLEVSERIVDVILHKLCMKPFCLHKI